MAKDYTKPLGIILVVIYSTLNGFLTLGLSFIATLLTAVPSYSALALILVTLLTAHSIFMFAAVYGLWILKSWGLRLAFWLYVLYIPLGFLSIFPILPGTEMSTANTVFQLVFIGIDVLIIVYLNKLEIALLYDAL